MTFRAPGVMPPTSVFSPKAWTPRTVGNLFCAGDICSDQVTLNRGAGTLGRNAKLMTRDEITCPSRCTADEVARRRCVRNVHSSRLGKLCSSCGISSYEVSLNDVAVAVNINAGGCISGDYVARCDSGPSNHVVRRVGKD